MAYTFPTTYKGFSPQNIPPTICPLNGGNQNIIIVCLQNATIEYSLEYLCVCVCFRVCVFLTITQKEIDLGT